MESDAVSHGTERIIDDQPWSDEEHLEENINSTNETEKSEMAIGDSKLNDRSNVTVNHSEFLNNDDEPSNQDVLDYNTLNVSIEIKELFQFIQRYQPQQLEIETKLKPFLPDFIPAVGDPDAFLKVDRPDAIEEKLGLYVLDEPSLEQAEKSILDLQLRSVYKQTSAKKILAKTVQDATKNKAIDKWIKDISDLHRSKPLLAVTCSRPLPDIDTLLDEWWSPEVEDLIIRKGTFPSSDLDCNINLFADICCGLLEIPVQDGIRIQSLHLLLTLYSEMGRLQK